jgi:hypothetical protein
MYADDLDGAIAEVDDMLAAINYGWDSPSDKSETSRLGESDRAGADTAQVAVGSDK